MVGKRLMGRARVGTFLDKNEKLHNADSEADNSDVLHESAEKLPILRPILKADVFKTLQNLARKHIIPLVKDAILSLLPPKALEQVDGASRNVQNGDLPDWMHGLMGEIPGDEKEGKRKYRQNKQLSSRITTLPLKMLPTTQPCLRLPRSMYIARNIVLGETARAGIRSLM